MLTTNPAKGTRDILPGEVELRRHVTSKVFEVYEKYGFRQIETPAIENIEQLTSGQGGDNEKMVFQILKRGEKLDPKNVENIRDLVDLGLRFDLTVPLARFYANNRASLPDPFKAIQMGSVWRAERPQKGRFRQFTQCDIDVFAEPSNLTEIELILATSDALLNVGFDKFTVKINDRRVLSEIARDCGFGTEDHDKVFIILDKLDKIGLEGVSKELNEGVFAKEATNKFLEKVDFILNNKPTAQDLKSLLPNLDEEVFEQLNSTIDSVKAVSNGKFSLELDLALVRGMGYYTGHIFEVVLDGVGYSVAGGGRYDKMVGKMLKEDVPACGFSIGFERIIQILQERDYKVPNTKEKVALIYNKDLTNFTEMVQKTQQIRQQKTVNLIPRKKNFTKQIDDLASEGYSAFASYREEQELNFKEI